MQVQNAIDYEAMAQCINDVEHNSDRPAMNGCKQPMDDLCEPKIFLGGSNPSVMVLDINGRLIS
jgi:hypothetical protein